MDQEYLNFDGAERPYSQAVRVGPLLFTSGASIGWPEDDIEVQTAKSLDYLADILKRSGTDLQHVVKATIFLADIGEWARFNDVWKRYFPTNKPVRTTTEVGRFADHARVEIDFVALVPGVE